MAAKNEFIGHRPETYASRRPLPPAGRFTNAELKYLEPVADFFERSPEVARLEKLLNSHPGVRSEVRLSTLLTGFLLTMFLQQSMLDCDVYATLRKLPKRWKKRLGIHQSAGRVLSYHQLGHRRRRLVSLTRRLDRDRDLSLECGTLVRLFNEALLHTADGIPFNRVCAVDGKIEPAWESPDSAVDPETGEKLTEAKWGHKTPKRRGKELEFGWEAQVVSTADPGKPQLALAVVPHPNDTGLRPEVLPAVESLAERGLLDTVLLDGGYYYKDPDVFAARLERAGIGKLFNPRMHQRKGAGAVQGAVILDGDLYCPCIPEGLGTLVTITGSNRERLEPQYEAREPYRLVPHGSTPAGTPRFRCPARAGKVRCSRVPESLKLAATKVTINTAAMDDLPMPSVCEQKAVTVPLPLLVKDQQQYPYGSQRFNRTYNLRNKVESFNSQLARSGFTFSSFRTTGLQNFALVLGIATLTTNLRSIRGWVAGHPDHDLE